MKSVIEYNNLSQSEMSEIYGGAAPGSQNGLISPVVATISWALSELSKIAMEYQASLPPSLKK